MYTVEMITSVGCTGIDSVYVIVLSDEIPKECMYIPNAFTPNRDGLNDTFMPVPGCELTFYQLNIFDRWGELLFVSHDVTEGWDGVYKGNLCPADAYVYKIVYRTEEASDTGLDIVKTGVVTILYK
jgi:gliding motility-associated-like protein